MSEYTKEQEAEALRVLALGSRTERVLAIVFAMAKRTAEAEAHGEQVAIDAFAHHLADVSAERDALKARAAELEAKLSETTKFYREATQRAKALEEHVMLLEAAAARREESAFAPPPVVVTREMVEALHDYVVHTGADWSAHHERLVSALMKALEAKP